MPIASPCLPISAERLMRLDVFAMQSPLKMAKNGMTIYKYIELVVGVKK